MERLHDAFPKELRSGLRLARFAGTCAGTLAAYEVAIRAAGEHRHDDLFRFTRTILVRQILRSLGVQTHSRGIAPTATRARLVVANHRTAADVGVVVSHAPGYFLSRGDIAEWPVLGSIAMHAGTIFVDRGSGHSGAKAIRTIRKLLKAGETVIVFPEGTTFPGDELRPFSAGAFAAARGIDAEILPVGLAYPPGVEWAGVDFLTHVRAVSERHRTPVAVEIGTPFCGQGTSAEMAQRAHDAVGRLVSMARERFVAGNLA